MIIAQIYLILIKKYSLMWAGTGKVGPFEASILTLYGKCLQASHRHFPYNVSIPSSGGQTFPAHFHALIYINKLIV